MKYARIQNRMGATAIAAVLALSSTPLVAQEAPSLATPPIEAPTADPTPATESAPDPLAAEPAPEASTPAETTTVEAAEPAPAARSFTKKAVPARTVERQATRAAAPKVTTDPAPAPMPEPTAEAPSAAAWNAAEAPPAEAPAAPEQQNAQLEEALPLAGGAGAVILALAGVGMAVRRRKRREEEEVALDHEAYAESTDAQLPEVEAEEPAPAWSEPVIQPKPDPIAPAKKMETDISDDFDTSRFGRHVQAAYRGPTPENPSLSLRKRLKLAAELDRRERMHEGMPKPAPKPVTAPMPADERSAFSFGGTATQAKTPEYQS